MRQNNNLSKILIIDFGSQFTQLIARRIRELGVYSEIISHKKLNNLQDLKLNVKGLIFSGGPLNVYETNKVKFNKAIFDLNIPILGICFGHQIISKTLGGKVKKSKHKEFGLVKIIKIKNSVLTKNFFKKNNKNNVWMSHSDEVIKLPKGFIITGKSKNSKMCIIENNNKKIFGVQFHPEVTHTINGIIILKNFIFTVCKVKKNWSLKQHNQVLINLLKSTRGYCLFNLESAINFTSSSNIDEV